MNFLLAPLIVLFSIAVLAACILYVSAKKFKIEEDPIIDEVEQLLPGANCGGCGFAGCRQLAEKCVVDKNLEENKCPVGGNEVMQKIAAKLGLEAQESSPKIVVVRCKGYVCNRVKTTKYDGVKSCIMQANQYGGETDCSYGCLGMGDCVAACNFGAISINEETGIPVIDHSKCTTCGACVKACPKFVLEMREKTSPLYYVACLNKEKGAVAKKACSAACIGCGICVKNCPSEAITLENNVAYINEEKCAQCGTCVEKCPTKAINELV